MIACKGACTVLPIKIAAKCECTAVLAAGLCGIGAGSLNKFARAAFDLMSLYVLTRLEQERLGYGCFCIAVGK